MQDSEIFLLRGEAHHPWHLYVGVLLYDQEGRVAVVKDPDGSYVLPRETVGTDDSLARLVHRLILEQVGVVPHVDRYLGTLVTPFDRFDGTKTEKAVLYLEAHFESLYHGRYADAEHEDGLVRWLPQEEAATLLKQQPWGEEAILARFAERR